MNPSTFKAFSKLRAPSYRGEPINTLAVNRWGDVFALSDSGLSYTSLMHKEEGCRSLSFSGEDLQLLSQMTCIKFNSFGTMLLVWGSNAAGVITLPRTYTLYGEFPESDKTKGCSFIALVGPEDSCGRLAKVAWHPFHAEYVVFLHRRGPLQMINIFTKSTTTVSLSQSIQYSSFSFGPCIGWMALSVLVLGENGSVFVVCPLVPVGALIPVEVVLQMAEGLNQENEISGHLGGDRVKLLKLANLYMSAAFGDLSGEYRAPNDMIRVGGPLVSAEKSDIATTGLPELSYHQRLLLEILQCPPALQGAVIEIGDMGRSTGDAASNKRQHLSGASSKTQGGISSSLGSPDDMSKGAKRKGGSVEVVSACDIAVLPAPPGERGDESDWTSSDCAPVVVLVSTDGATKLCVLKGKMCPHWDDIATSKDLPLLHEAIGGGYNATIGEDLLLRPLPEMIVVERRDSPVQTDPSNATTSQLWSLRADPVLRHCYHMIAHGSGAAFLISVRWVADALVTMQSAHAKSSSTNESRRSRSYLDSRDLAEVLDDTPTFTASNVISVFPTVSVSSSVARGHPLSAFSVVHDPTFGHIALFQTNSASSASTAISSVNLTVLLASIAQEQRLMNKMQRTVYASGDVVAASSAEHLSIDRDDALHKSACRILQRSERSLQDCRLQLEQHRRERESGEAAPSVDLSTTWTQLDTDVVTPLEELQQRVDLSVDIVRDVYEAQVEMLSGADGSTKGGLIRQLERVLEKQKSIDKRMKLIAENLEDEVSVCAGIMAFASFKVRELTTGEKEYKAELARCGNVVSRLDAAIQSLEKMQIQRTRLSKAPRAILTPPSGMKNRLASQVSPIPTSPPGRFDNMEGDTANLEASFLSMGLKSKAKKEKADSLQFQMQQCAIADRHPSRDVIPERDGFSGEQDQLNYGEFNVYSTHTPFVTPLRARHAEVPDSASSFSSFQSPAASTGKSIRMSEPRNSAGHWTVHNFTSTTPHRSGTSTSKWSVNRPSATSNIKVAARSPFIPSHKRRQQTDAEEEFNEPAKKLTENRVAAAAESANTRPPNKLSTMDQDLIDKLGREGSDIEYLCKEITDVEKRVVALTNASLSLPFGENTQFD